MNTKRILLIFLLLVIIPSVVFSQNDSIDKGFKPVHHPRILLFEGEEKDISKSLATEPVWSKMQAAILKESDLMINLPVLQRVQVGRRLLATSREALRRIFFLSYSYRTTGTVKYFERAEKELLAVAAFSDWNPSHFLDVGEMTMAVSIGYDWLYNQLPASSKNIIREAILKKGLEPSLDSKYNSWLTAEHNWNQVCNAGMTYGAMAIYEDYPELSARIINRAIKSIALPMKDYGPDGAYPEGYGYWGYGTSFNVMFLSAVEKLFGSDFGLSTAPGFLNTAAYMENMTGPMAKPFNYSDAGGNGGLHPAMFWFAAKSNNPSLLWVEKSYLQKEPSAHVRDRLLPALMLWKKGISTKDIVPPKSTVWIGKGKTPVGMMRTDWKDTNAIYVGMKGGSASVNHAHMDIGSFVMDADGVRWAMDFGMQDYETLESKGIKLFGRTQDAQRWTVFRLTNLVHNTLAINNQHQRVAGNAPITSSSASPGFMHTITDLSEIYKGQLLGAKRGIAIADKSYVVVRDEIQTSNEPATVRWTMLTPATVKITGTNKAALTKDGKNLVMEVQSDAKVTMKTWSTDPPNTYDAANPGTTLVGFEVTIPANTATALTVKLVPGKALKKSTKSVQPLSTWK